MAESIGLEPKLKSPQTTGTEGCSFVTKNWKLWQLSWSPAINSNLVLLYGIMVPFSGPVLRSGHVVLGLGKGRSCNRHRIGVWRGTGQTNLRGSQGMPMLHIPVLSCTAHIEPGASEAGRLKAGLPAGSILVVPPKLPNIKAYEPLKWVPGPFQGIKWVCLSVPEV